jgi:hypothetical protein
MGGHPGESVFPGLSLELSEHRIAELGFAVADAEVAIRSADLPRPRGSQVHEAFGLGNGQRADKDLVVQREHRRRRADAERQHHDHDERKPRTQLELTQRELELVHDSPGDSGLAISGTRHPYCRMPHG